LPTEKSWRRSSRRRRRERRVEEVEEEEEEELELELERVKLRLNRQRMEWLSVYGIDERGREQWASETKVGFWFFTS
jgi:hypothetical protein